MVVTEGPKIFDVQCIWGRIFFHPFSNSYIAPWKTIDMPRDKKIIPSRDSIFLQNLVLNEIGYSL